MKALMSMIFALAILIPFSSVSALEDVTLRDVRVGIEQTKSGYMYQTDDAELIVVDPVYALKVINSIYDDFFQNNPGVLQALLEDDAVAIEISNPVLGARSFYIPISKAVQLKYNINSGYFADGSLPRCSEGEVCWSVGQQPGMNCTCYTECECIAGSQSSASGSECSACPNREPKPFYYDDVLLLDLPIGTTLPPLWREV